MRDMRISILPLCILRIHIMNMYNILCRLSQTSLPLPNYSRYVCVGVEGGLVPPRLMSPLPLGVWGGALLPSMVQHDENPINNKLVRKYSVSR